MKYIKVKVKTEEKEYSIKKKKEDSFELSIKEPAENNRANKALIEVMAKYLNLPENKVTIVKGHTSPSKILGIYEEEK
ncbi:MAG: DUF167 domain-containing protein [Elusimicrobiota bacterium]